MASSQLTPTTGCAGFENMGSDQKVGLDALASSTKILNSRLVTGNLPMPKLSTHTSWSGISFSGPCLLPIKKKPARMETMSAGDSMNITKRTYGGGKGNVKV